MLFREIRSRLASLATERPAILILMLGCIKSAAVGSSACFYLRTLNVEVEKWRSIMMTITIKGA